MIDVPCPFPFSVSPHVEKARENLAAWTRDNGLLHGASARERLDRADFGWFAALVHPTADEAGLDLMAQWFAWLFLVDDQLDDGDLGRSPKRMAELVTLMRDVLGDPGPGHDPSLPPVVASLADLWRRTAPGASPRWGRRFVRHLEECLATATLWEAENRMRGTVPTEDSYIANRRHTGAIYVCMDLVEIVAGAEVPADAYDTPEFATALDAACDVVCWVNDVYSLAKERSLGEVHNLVHVVQHHRGLDEHQALEEVYSAIGQRTDLYLAAEEKLLATYPDESWPRPVLAGMRTWMRGNLDWSRCTERYTSGFGDADAYIEAAMLEGGRP